MSKPEEIKGEPGATQAPSASDLRATIAERELGKMKAQAEKEAAAKAAEKAIADRFMNEGLDEAMMEGFRRRIRAAVERGDLEVLLGEFPSTFTTDGGRAINNLDPDWPSTLQGKALDVYRAWKERLQPQGYRLYARIENFPGGIPGNVGMYLSWKE
jgi:hypothetical protein